MPPFEEQGAYCFANVVGRSVLPSVFPLVDQMVSDHYLEHFLSQSFHMLIGLGEDKNPIDFGFTGIKGQGHKGHFCDKLC